MSRYYTCIRAGIRPSFRGYLLARVCHPRPEGWVVTSPHNENSTLIVHPSTVYDCAAAAVVHALLNVVRLKLTKESNYPGCRSGRDGECNWKDCPQLHDGEPGATGRHCPRDLRHEDE